MFRRVHAWIQKGDDPPDIIGDALFRLNKAALVYIAAPTYLFLGAYFLIRWVF